MGGIRLGVLGGGIMGQRVAKSAADSGRFRITSIGDANLDRASTLASEYGASAHQSMHALFDGPEIDAVYVGLPHHLHLPACLAAAQAGVHVLIDKPLCTTLDEAEHIVAAARGSSSVWMVGFSYRFRSEWRRVHEIVSGGGIGTPYFVTDVVVEAYESLPDWYWDPASGGGTLHLQSHHTFDRQSWVLGSGPSQVACQIVRLPNGAEKSAQLTVMYDSGALAGVSLSFGLTYNEPQPLTLFVIQGESGMVQLDNTRTLRHVTANGIVEEKHFGDDWLGREITEFADAVSGITDGFPTVADGVNALRGAVAAATAAELHSWVAVSDGGPDV